jgi:hypothetical protein
MVACRKFVFSHDGRSVGDEILTRYKISRHSMVFVLGLSAIIVAGACANHETPRSGVMSSQLSDSALGSLAYRIPVLSGQAVTLQNGEWAGDSGIVGRQTVSIIASAQGDMSGDGVADAVVMLLTDPGATGKFFDLVPVTAASGAPRVGRATSIGDRVRPETLWVSNGVVTLRLLTHDSTDGACCPSRREEQRFHLSGDSLVLDGSTLLNRAPARSD